LFSGAFDGLSAIWEISANRAESSRSKNVGWLRGGPQKKIKSVCYLPSLRQVITGLESGWVALWDTATGKLIRMLTISHVSYQLVAVFLICIGDE
jgi:WD40 repeat protein